MTRTRPTVGLLINTLGTDYQRQLWKGAEAAAAAHGVNLLVFIGGHFDSPVQFEVQRSYLTQFIGQENIDGLIVVSSILSTYQGPDKLFERIKAQVGDLPVVNLGPPHPGICSVAVDNVAGQRAAVQHLITAHGRRRFVYMGAVPGNTDGDLRRHTFLATLAENGLAPVEGGMLVGHFNRAQAREALAQWLPQGRPFDAVVAANDSMAFGCFDALEAWGLDVPEAVSITGFDDDQAAQAFLVPLTTVDQPIRAVAAKAVELLLGLIGHQPTPPTTFVDTELVVRQSCGCPAPPAPSGTGRRNPMNQTLRDLEQSRKNVLLTMSLSQSSNLDNLAPTLDVQLPSLGVSACAVLLFDPGTDGRSSHVVYALGQDFSDPGSPRARSFPTAQLFPDPRVGDTHRFAYVIESLFYGDQQFGLLMLARDPEDDNGDGILNAQIRGAVKAAVLTEELRRTNELLKQNQEKLIRTEKMAVLGVLVSGLSHELNTPIGVALTASSHSERLVVEAARRLETEEVPQALTQTLLGQILEINVLTRRNLERVVDLVESFRRVSFDLHSDDLKVFDLVAFVREVLQTLGPEWGSRSVQVEFEAPETLSLRSYPGVFHQILENLAANSLRHGFADQGGGKVRITLSREAGTLVLTYGDDGVGMGAEALAHLFEPFYGSMSPSKGSGLGSFVVYNLVTLNLKGTIKAASSPGRGLTYEIRVPLEGWPD